MPGSRVYQFGPFRIDSAERLLFRGEETVPLTPKVVETLLALVSNPGRLLEKDELMKTIWPDSFVEEGGLARNVSLLRKVLEEGAPGMQFIETIPKRGYRFIARVEEGEEVPIARAEPPAAAPRLRRRWAAWPIAALALVAGAAAAVYLWPPGPARASSLVVLPLKNLSHDTAQDAFAEQLTAELINSLAKIQALRVPSLTTALTYKGVNRPLPQIARELNVEAVVEGSVVEAGAKVRIDVQLFDAKTEKPIWAESYDRDLRDVLVLESEVAGSIAREIQVKLTPGEKRRLAGARAIDPEAYLDYARGRVFWNKRTPEGIAGAIDYYRRTIAKDPRYAPAWSGLADAYALLGSLGADARPPREVMPKAKQAALEAVRLDDTLADGHVSLGYVLMSYDWDLAAARREFQRAIALSPGHAAARHWYAHYWLAMGKPGEAAAEARRAQLLDPASPAINTGVGWSLYHGRRYDEAIEQYRATLEMYPDFGLARCTLGLAYLEKGLYPRAIEEFNRGSGESASASFAMAGLGCAYGLSGRREEARRVLDQLTEAARRQYVPSIYLAALYASIGEKDRSIELVRSAYDERSDYMIYLKTEPWADGLRSDPRFQRLLELVAAGGG